MSFSPRVRPVIVVLVFLVLPLTACVDEEPVAPAAFQPAASLTTPAPIEALGRAIFFDRSLSLHQNQSCGACHAPEFGFTGPTSGINLGGGVYMGSVRSRAGGRKPPSAAYAAMSPLLHFDAGDGVWVGGNFWDGRATGHVLGNPAADQAVGPFLNPVEQALIDPICVLHRIATGSYAHLWQAAYGEDVRTLSFPPSLDRQCRAEEPISYSGGLAAAVTLHYGRVGLAVAAYEASSEVNAFSSKYDAFLAGRAQLTAQEQLGLELFEGKAMCSACHPSEGAGALFTDYTYDNLGLPKNPLNPVYAEDPGFIDRGLGDYLRGIGDPDAAQFDGAMKVPTLRNVARAPGNAPKAFGHNGVFKSLEQIIHFYNTRDVLPRCTAAQLRATRAGLAQLGTSPACWPAPEVAANVNTEELGDLGLTTAEERAIVAFLHTLSDGWKR